MFESLVNNIKSLDKKKKIVIIAAVAAVLLIVIAFSVFFSGMGAVDKNDDKSISVNIPNGSGGMTIIEILDEHGLIKNKFIAKVQMKIGGYDSLQANTYIFNKSMGLKEMLKAINTGDFNYLSKESFTIIEGATIPDAAEAIAQKFGLKKSDILAKWNNKAYLKTLIDKYWFLTNEILDSRIMFPLEGYLYPETYIVTDDKPSIESITEMILDKTNIELNERKSQIDASCRTVHQFLTLSSIVQNESLYAKDRPMIAGVFINRLKKGMPLQSDITVLYALQEKRVNVTYKDLEVNSPYNTYKYAGLPVGPVCSIPDFTMDDVLNYKSSDYLYFFATKDGEVIYNKTLAQHEKTVQENLWY